MGTSLSVEYAEVFIPASRVLEALAALKALSAHGRLDYTWPERIATALTLEQAIRECNWDAVTSPDGSVAVTGFDGSSYGSDDQIFDALAPFIEDGGQISLEFDGDEDDVEVWRFRGGKRLVTSS